MNEVPGCIRRRMLDVYNLGLGGIERERKHKVLAWMSELIGAIDSPARQGYPACCSVALFGGETLVPLSRPLYIREGRVSYFVPDVVLEVSEDDD